MSRTTLSGARAPSAATTSRRPDKSYDWMRARNLASCMRSQPKSCATTRPATLVANGSAGCTATMLAAVARRSRFNAAACVATNGRLGVRKANRDADVTDGLSGVWWPTLPPPPCCG